MMMVMRGVQAAVRTEVAVKTPLRGGGSEGRGHVAGTLEGVVTRGQEHGVLELVGSDAVFKVVQEVVTLRGAGGGWGRGEDGWQASRATAATAAAAGSGGCRVATGYVLELGSVGQMQCLA